MLYYQHSVLAKSPELEGMIEVGRHSKGIIRFISGSQGIINGVDQQWMPIDHRDKSRCRDHREPSTGSIGTIGSLQKDVVITRIS
jgi:hypothetical protein